MAERVDIFSLYREVVATADKGTEEIELLTYPKPAIRIIPNKEKVVNDDHFA